MITYLYKSTDNGARGYNQCITVYRVKNNVPQWLGYNDKISTASSYGERGEAVTLLGELCGHKNNHYKFDSKNIQLLEV